MFNKTLQHLITEHYIYQICHLLLTVCMYCVEAGLIESEEGSVELCTEHMSGSWGSQGTDETLLRCNQTRRGRQKVRGRKREREPPQDRHCLFIFPLRSSGARCPWKIAK